MVTVPERPPGANATDPSAPRVDLTDPLARGRWLAALREQTANATAAGLDAAAPKRHRVLSRAEAKRKIHDADEAIASLLAAAGVAIDDAPSREPMHAPDAHREAIGDEPWEEARALDEAWRDIIAARRGDESLADRPIITVLLAALVAGPYESAEMDSVGVAVLRAIRATVDGWAHARGTSTSFAAVPFVDLVLLTRRLDAAMGVRHEPPTPPHGSGRYRAGDPRTRRSHHRRDPRGERRAEREP